VGAGDEGSYITELGTLRALLEPLGLSDERFESDSAQAIAKHLPLSIDAAAGPDVNQEQVARPP
jgi:hypothetical protein